MGECSQKLDLNQVRIRWLATDATEHLQRLFIASLVHEPPWREWHEQDANSEDDRRNDLECERQAPRGLALTFPGTPNVVRAEVDPEGHHDAERDCQLLQGNKTAAYFRRRDLRATCDMSI